MTLNNISHVVVLLLLIGSIAETKAGPLAYAACISSCLAAVSGGGVLIVGALAGGASCHALCLPLLAAPTP